MRKFPECRSWTSHWVRGGSRGLPSFHLSLWSLEQADHQGPRALPASFRPFHVGWTGPSFLLLTDHHIEANFSLKTVGKVDGLIYKWLILSQDDKQ